MLTTNHQEDGTSPVIFGNDNEEFSNFKKAVKNYEEKAGGLPDKHSEVQDEEKPV